MYMALGGSAVAAAAAAATEGVRVSDDEGELVTVAPNESDGVCDGEGVCVEDGEGLGVCVEDGEGLGVSDDDGDGVCVGVGLSLGQGGKTTVA